MKEREKEEVMQPNFCGVLSTYLIKSYKMRSDWTGFRFQHSGKAKRQGWRHRNQAEVEHVTL